ncbi:MAG: sulfotransferase family protein [Acidimicrobiia bacterium]
MGALSDDAERFFALDLPPVFVVGAARSGTTWVYDVLAAHPQVAGVFESFLFTTGRGIGGLVSLIDRPGSPAGMRRFVPTDDLVREARQFAAGLLGRSVVPGRAVLVEKSGTHACSMHGIWRLFPDARFVHVLRDGRDVVVSALAAQRSWAPTWPRSTYRAAREWVVNAQSATDSGAARPDQFLEIRYENLRADAAAGYRTLYDFCGLPFDDGLLAEVVDRNDFDRHHAGGEDEFRRGGRVGDWRTRFSRADVVQFSAAAGRTLVRLGYEPDHRWAVRRFAIGGWASGGVR